MPEPRAAVADSVRESRGESAPHRDHPTRRSARGQPGDRVPSRVVLPNSQSFAGHVVPARRATRRFPVAVLAVSSLPFYQCATRTASALRRSPNSPTSNRHVHVEAIREPLICGSGEESPILMLDYVVTVVSALITLSAALVINYMINRNYAKPFR